MSHLIKAPQGTGHQSVFQAGEHDAKWLGLEILRLPAGESWEGELAEEEAALVFLTGRAGVRVKGSAQASWEGLGGRADIFSGPGSAVYASRRSRVAVTAESNLELAIAKAPCQVDLPPRLINPEEVKVISAGMANWRRDVRLVIPPGSPISQRLIVGETINPPGNWSGIPPHKHDEVTPGENFLEEFYLFKARPADCYVLQLMGRKGEERAQIIGRDDVAILLDGYHPTAAAPGVTIGYLWVLSGDSKAYDISIDPRFEWIGTAEAVLKEQQRA
jgi:5-deoxy-glucuronate isomerase